MSFTGKPLTLDQWRQWSLRAKRNYTDDPIGFRSAGKRAIDAQHSRLVASQPRTEPRRKAA